MNWWRGKRPEEFMPEPARDTPDLDSPAPRKEDRILAMQRSLGNHAVQRLLPQSEGESLNDQERASLESSFGVDLSEVRLHKDGSAAALAEDHQASALTAGRDIYFAPGAYGSGTLAHEVVHVVQQSHAGSLQRNEDAELESEAREASVHAGAGKMARVTQPAAAPAVQRQPLPGYQESRLRLMPDWSVTIDRFDIGKFQISATQKTQLDTLASRILGRISLVRELTAQVVGFADVPGGEERNKVLGQERADAVRNYLIGKGVPEDALTASSLGESFLAIDTKNYEARNRRVEIYVHERSFRPLHLGEPPTLKPLPPVVTPKPLDLTYHPPIHVPTPQEEMEENLRRNLEIDKLAHDILEREKSKPSVSAADVFGRAMREITKKMGLPKWIQDKAQDLGEKLPSMGANALFDQITADRNLSESEKNAVHSAIEALTKTKIK